MRRGASALPQLGMLGLSGVREVVRRYSGALALRLSEDYTLIVRLLDRKKFQVRLIVYVPNRNCRCRRL